MEACSLCIVGAGYAGLNAFNAASKYLPSGARVVIVDKQSRWGGQFVEQYEFVRLHQGYPLFTAGEREWAISGKKPLTHLATKNEILQHYEDVVEANVKEKELELVTLFQYEYSGYIVQNGKVQLVAKSTIQEEHISPPPVMILADRLIIATGANVPRKFPIEFSAPLSAVHSLCPADILSPKWHPIMKYSRDADKPIWIIGSGKTAMDVIYTLSQQQPTWRSRLRCIAGRGTWFMDRDMIETGVDANGNLLPVYFLEMVAMFNGTNAQEVYQEFSRQGFFNSFVPDAQNFVAGIASKKEIDTVKATLMPATERILKAHLVDIEECSGEGLRMKLRSLDGQTMHYMPLERGSFIVNCTDNVVEGALTTQRIISDDGLVLATQNPLRHSGLSAHLQTHAWYLGVLDGVWQNYMVNPSWDYHRKDTMMLEGIVGHNTRLISAVLPKEILANTKGMAPPPNLPTPSPEFLKRLGELTMAISKRHEAMTKSRYTDQEPLILERKDVLGGNIGKQRSFSHQSKM